MHRYFGNHPQNIKRLAYCRYRKRSLTFRALALRQREPRGWIVQRPLARDGIAYRNAHTKTVFGESPNSTYLDMLIYVCIKMM